MKAYLKNGNTVRITQQMANDIAEMKIQQSKDPKNATNFLVSRNIISKNVFAFIDIDEVVAVR